MKNEIRNCMSWLINQLSIGYVYSNENKKDFEMFYEELKKHIDFTKITQKEAIELRFCKWEEESNLYLFPLYLVPLIPEGLEVISIGGTKYKYEKEKADNDIRFGCVAYGIEIKEVNNENRKRV